MRWKQPEGGVLLLLLGQVDAGWNVTGSYNCECGCDLKQPPFS
jgi:hypothetical protein